MDDSEWQRKGATLSNVTARKELGLSGHEIAAAIREGRLQWREGSAHGNPFLRLLRREVEALVRRQHGAAYVRNKKTEAELVLIDRELRRFRRQISDLEDRRAKLSEPTVPATPRRRTRG